MKQLHARHEDQFLLAARPIGCKCDDADIVRAARQFRDLRLHRFLPFVHACEASYPVGPSRMAVQPLHHFHLLINSCLRRSVWQPHQQHQQQQQEQQHPRRRYQWMPDRGWWCSEATMWVTVRAQSCLWRERRCRGATWCTCRLCPLARSSSLSVGCMIRMSAQGWTSISQHIPTAMWSWYHPAPPAGSFSLAVSTIQIRSCGTISRSDDDAKHVDTPNAAHRSNILTPAFTPVPRSLARSLAGSVHRLIA